MEDVIVSGSPNLLENSRQSFQDSSGNVWTLVWMGHPYQKGYERGLRPCLNGVVEEDVVVNNLVLYEGRVWAFSWNVPWRFRESVDGPWITWSPDMRAGGINPPYVTPYVPTPSICPTPGSCPQEFHDKAAGKPIIHSYEHPDFRLAVRPYDWLSDRSGVQWSLLAASEFGQEGYATLHPCVYGRVDTSVTTDLLACWEGQVWIFDLQQPELGWRYKASPEDAWTTWREGTTDFSPPSVQLPEK